jgi:TatD DNase family protein
MDVQRDALDRHVRLAQERDMPVILHCREAESDMLPMLREAARRKPLRGAMHSFSSDWPTAEECLALGLFLSFSGPVTYANRKFDAIREVARRVPADRFLVETDSPYLTPHPLRGKLHRNEPAHVALVASRLAELRGCSAEEVAAQTTANARALFRLP